MIDEVLARMQESPEWQRVIAAGYAKNLKNRIHRYKAHRRSLPAPTIEKRDWDALQLLKNTRFTIIDPDRWVRGALARNKFGHDVDVQAQEATCWCVVGALYLNAERYRTPLTSLRFAAHQLAKAANIIASDESYLSEVALLEAYSVSALRDLIITWQDFAEHDDIIKALDTAIRNIEREL